MKFRYNATAKNGKKTTGELEVDSKDLALKELRERGFFVTSLTEAAGPRQFTIGGVSALEKVTLTKHLGIMLRSGIPLDEGLRILESEAKGKLKKILQKVLVDVKGGDTLSDSLEKFPETFNNYYIHMIVPASSPGGLRKIWSS
jgi:type II secretory pathway component PulF